MSKDISQRTFVEVPDGAIWQLSEVDVFERYGCLDTLLQDGRCLYETFDTLCG